MPCIWPSKNERAEERRRTCDHNLDLDLEVFVAWRALEKEVYVPCHRRGERSFGCQLHAGSERRRADVDDERELCMQGASSAPRSKSRQLKSHYLHLRAISLGGS